MGFKAEQVVCKAITEETAVCVLWQAFFFRLANKYLVRFTQ